MIYALLYVIAVGAIGIALGKRIKHVREAQERLDAFRRRHQFPIR